MGRLPIHQATFSFREDRRHNRHPDSQHMSRVFPLFQDDLHGNPLHDFDIASRGVLRREDPGHLLRIGMSVVPTILAE